MRRFVALVFVLSLFEACGRNSLYGDGPDDGGPLAPGTAGGGGVGQAGGSSGASGTAGLGGHGGSVGGAGTGGNVGSAGTGGHAGTGGSVGSAGTDGHAGTGGNVGSAGAGGHAGVGGAAGGPSSCVPGRSVACSCTTGMQGAQVCQADGTFAPCVCVPETYERVKEGMVGAWVGTETSPWNVPFMVRLEFGADGHYSAHCAQASCPAPVFYYGTDDDSPEKTYRLTDDHADGTCVGKIAIYFFPQDTTVGALEEVTLSDDGLHLHFEFWNTWQDRRYGPIVFELTRAM